MTNTFFTADCHFDHKNIIEYSKRPFIDMDDMNNTIIRNWNSVVGVDDLIYHIGDFAFKNSCNLFEEQLNGNIVHIRGNHDNNNGVKTLIHNATLIYGGLTIYATHKPPEDGQTLPKECNIILCGHVHNLWKWKMLDNRYMINVGVDVWNYKPVSIHSILKLIANIKKGYVKQ